MFDGLKQLIVRALRWSEAYTKTDMVYLAHGGFWLFAGHAIQLASGLILAIAFANLVPKEVFGTYQFIIAGAVIISACTLIGMGTAIARATAQGSEGALRAGFRVQLRWSIGVALAAAGLAIYYHVNGNDTLALSFLIVGSFSPFLNAFSLARSYLAGKQLFREHALFGLSRKVIPVAALLIAIPLTQDPVILILVYFASNTLAAGLLYTMTVRRYRLSMTDEREMIDYSKHLSFMRIFAEVAGQADKVLIWVFLGAAPLAAYALAQLPVTHIRGVFKLSFTLTFPKISKSVFSQLQDSLHHKVLLLFLTTLGATAAYIIAAPFLFAIFFPAYPEAVLVSQVLVLSVLFIPRSLYRQALVAHQKTRELYTLDISQNILRVVLLLALLPLFGVWGAVAAVMGTQLYSAVITQYLFRRTAPGAPTN